MQSVIEELRNDDEYYNGKGRYYLSNSDIYSLLTNPKLFRVPSGDSKHFHEGRLFHQLILEPEKAVNVPQVDVSTRNTKEYKKYLEDSGLSFAMLTKEYEEIVRLASVMKSNFQFYNDIYRDGNLYEEPTIGEIKGLQWKAKADIVTSDSIIDLKTTSDINKFRWSAKSYNYDSQCYIYQQLFGKPLYFYVIDKESEQLGLFRPSEEFVKGGEAKVERAMEVYYRYFGPNPTDDIDNYFINETL
jgi:PDDEXK-like domain of unknown function (DUF3799)